MSKDPINDRFTKRQKNRKLSDLSRKGMTPEEIEAEEAAIENAEKVEPIRAGKEPGRNDPCPCGSGKKYKKCCYGQADAAGKRDGLLGAIKRKLGGQ